MIINKFTNKDVRNFEQTIQMIFDHSEVIDYHLDKLITKCKRYMMQHKKTNHSILKHNIEIAQALLNERSKTV